MANLPPDALQASIQATKDALRKMVSADKLPTVDLLCDKASELQVALHDLEMDDESYFTSYAVGHLKFMSYVPADLLNDRCRVLDLGCSDGRSLITLKRAFGMQGWGVDKFSLLKTSEHRRRRTKVIADLYRKNEIEVISPFDFEKTPLPYEADAFDLVLCQQTIEHLHNSPKSLLAEVFRILRPGGRFLIDTPNIAFYQNRLKLLRGETVHWDLKLYYDYGLSIDGEYMGHTREFSIGELKEMLQWAGFAIEVAETVFYEPPPTPLDIAIYVSAEMANYIANLVGKDVAAIADLRAALIESMDSPSAFVASQLATMNPVCVIMGKKPQ